MGEGGVAVSSHLLEEGALAATELLSRLPCESMGGFLVFGLQALSLDLLVIVVIDIPTGRFDAGIRRLKDVYFDISLYVDGDISFGCLGAGPLRNSRCCTIIRQSRAVVGRSLRC